MALCLGRPIGYGFVVDPKGPNETIVVVADADRIDQIAWLMVGGRRMQADLVLRRMQIKCGTDLVLKPGITLQLLRVRRRLTTIRIVTDYVITRINDKMLGEASPVSRSR